MTISRRKLIVAAAAITPDALIPDMVLADTGEALASPQRLAARYLAWLDRERTDLATGLNFIIRSQNGQTGIFVPEDLMVDRWRERQCALHGRPMRAHDRSEQMLRLIGVSLDSEPS